MTFRKIGLTTQDAVRRIAAALGVDARDAGVAGQKDKVAVTTQTASFLVGRGVDPDAALATMTSPELTVLSIGRHANKLKPGHLLSNRFRIRLTRIASDEDRRAIVEKLEDARARGVPNHYGDQRFGNEGDNASRALTFVRGDRPPPRDKRQLRFLFSSLQSALFNRVLDLRIEDGSWAEVLPGDLAKKHDTGGLFEVALEGPDLEDAQARARSLAISATGPMFGASMRTPSGAVGALEQSVLAEAGIGMDALERFRNAGEGTRRALRLIPEELRWHDDGPDLIVEFELAKGGYATTLLGYACRLAPRASVPAEPDDPGAPAEPCGRDN